MRCKPRPALPNALLAPNAVGLLAPNAVVLLAIALLGLMGLVTPRGAGAQTGESYHLEADRLEGSLTGPENVYTAIRPRLTHGTTTVTGDSAQVYRTREYVLFRGHVKIVDGTTTMWGDEASYDRKQRLATLRGAVRIQEKGSVITGSEAWLDRNRNLSVITGRPHMLDSTRTLDADRIEYDRNSDVVLALGHVNAVDQAESTRVIAGRVRYDRRSDYAWADQAPHLELTESNGTITRIRGDSLEFDRVNDRVYARGGVEVRRDSLRATGDDAAFYRSENRAILAGSPKAWDSEGSASGDTLEIRFVQHRVSSIQARPNAKVAYEARADSAGARSERTTASGDTITLFLENEAARQAVIVGHASSFYWPSEADSAKGGRNASRGDTIVVNFDKGKPRHATVQGNGEGTYYMAAEGDTTGAEKRERILYSGREIDYDLKQNTVDVRGDAAIAYREMHLSAKQVHFNADTQKMRAEGSPVLQDGGDRIVGETMTYDLSIRRGAVLAGRTKYEQGYVTGERVLRVSEDILDIKSGTYTTCDLPDPHYHFGSGKMRILLHDKVIAKPVVFYIKHVPVLAIPFYIFPINSGRHSGFILPQFEFGSSSAAGKFVRNVGYYWAVSDYLDLTGAADYYQDDNWIAHGLVRYAKRYSYHGQVTGSFRDVFGGIPPRRDWHIQGSHFQPLGYRSTLTADVNLANSAQYLQGQTQSLANRVNRLLTSSVGYAKAWSGASFNAGFYRSQDLSPDPGAARVLQQLPSATFSLQPLTIGRLGRSGIPARLPWLAKTVINYQSQLFSQRNVFVNNYRDLLNQSDLRDSIVDARTAMRHDASITDTRHIGPLALQPRVNARGVYYSKDASGARNQFGGVWSASLGANTQIFGTLSRPIGPLRALRHVLTPSLAFTYQPRIGGLSFTDTAGVRRTRFDNLGGISLGSSEQQFLSFGVRNDFHVKVGSADRPRVINNLISTSTSGTYDLLAARQGRRALSDLSTSLTLKPIERSQFFFSFVNDPYTLQFKRVSVSTSFAVQGTSRAAEDSIQAMSDEPGESAVRTSQSYAVNEGLTSTSLPWRAGFAVSVSRDRNTLPGPSFGRWTSSSNVQGSLGMNISRGWRFDYGGNFDIEARAFSSHNFTITRELHCWQAQFTRSVTGRNQEYYFKINVKLLPEVYYEQGSSGLRGFGGQNTLTGGGY